MYQLRRIAWTFALKHRLHRPLTFHDLKAICNAENWDLYPYSKARSLIHVLNLDDAAENNDAFSAIGENNVVIFYKDNLTLSERVHRIAHEIGHILLNHTPCPSDDNQETEADYFSFELMLPSCVVYKCGIDDPPVLSVRLSLPLAATRYYEYVMDFESDTSLAKMILKQYSLYITEHTHIPARKKQNRFIKHVIASHILLIVLLFLLFVRYASISSSPQNNSQSICYSMIYIENNSLEVQL